MSSESVEKGTPIASVRVGLFFDPPAVLPRGRHRLSRDEVLDAQRERMMAATTELLAARGYTGFGPADIAKRAGVSLAAFYDCFTNKDSCIFAGYDRFITVLLQRLTALDIAGKDRRSLVPEVLHLYLDTLAEDLVVARAYQVEIDALGAPARKRRRDSLSAFAAYLSELLTRVSPPGAPSPDLPISALLGVVYATRQLAADALDESDEPDFETLAGQLALWLTDMFRQR
ncbi:TetR/AcrR family transcriptional regulator [Nocardia aurea]|uniref:TetR/AcrR family transcriptional regulator n=1 Tax=Nocardia aurea TaxID=2144174 RepID=A0ABV3FSK4_9NOCA